ncbi:biotin-dependent carboxyltransferase family protein [Pseudomonas sp. NA-150]|uniref:5-oxoprolinase subunit C family protein n=1 Tax=Pseudomonas sp. NA-150 TaxID=3367525 RepID=UPI0037CBC755
MNRLLIEQSSPLCLLQDAGRFGVRHLGVTQGGAADWLSMSWANWLLGNELDAAVVEITLGGFSVRAQSDCLLALAGANLGAHIDGRLIEPWQSFVLRQGERLQFSGSSVGARTYLAAPGGFDAKAVLGSCSTVLRDCLGGLNGLGLPLAMGDVLSARDGRSSQPLSSRRMSPTQIPDLFSRQPLDVVIGAQMADFAGRSLFDAFNSDWTVDARADRMGIRLLGPVLEYQGPAMISEGIPLGGIQVPPDGQPIVLGNDRQTIGGYPRLGALTPASLARLAQCLPGDTLRLRATVECTARESHLRLLQQWASPDVARLALAG